MVGDNRCCGRLLLTCCYWRTGVKFEIPCLQRVADMKMSGFCDATVDKWWTRFGGAGVLDARRVGEVKQENAKLKRLLAAKSCPSGLFAGRGS